MSRGLGRVQMGIIEALPLDGWVSSRELVRAVYGTETPAEHQLRAVRRAVAGLCARGLAQSAPGYDYYNARSIDAALRVLYVARPGVPEPVARPAAC